MGWQAGADDPPFPTFFFGDNGSARRMTNKCSTGQRKISSTTGGDAPTTQEMAKGKFSYTHPKDTSGSATTSGCCTTERTRNELISMDGRLTEGDIGS